MVLATETLNIVETENLSVSEAVDRAILGRMEAADGVAFTNLGIGSIAAQGGLCAVHGYLTMADQAGTGGWDFFGNDVEAEINDALDPLCPFVPQEAVFEVLKGKIEQERYIRSAMAREVARMKAQIAILQNKMGAMRQQAETSAASTDPDRRATAAAFARYAVALDQLIEDSIEMVFTYESAIDGNREAADALAQGQFVQTRTALESEASKTTGDGMSNGTMTMGGTGTDMMGYSVADLLPAQPTFFQRIYYALPAVDGTPWAQREVVLFSRYKMPMSRFIWIVIGLVFLLIYWREILRFFGVKVKKKSKKKKLFGLF